MDLYLHRMSLVESIPEGLTYNESLTHLSTYDAWVHLINSAEERIEIGSYYWTLQTSNLSSADKVSCWAVTNIHLPVK